MKILVLVAACIALGTSALADDLKISTESIRSSDDPTSCTEDFEEDKILNCMDNCIAVLNTAQIDSDQDGFGNACDTDISDVVDCVTNYFDYIVLTDAMFSDPSSLNWNPDADFNADDTVNFQDVAIFAGYFLLEPGPSGLANCEN